MADELHYLAIDLGAESGRGELVTLDASKGLVRMEELHRFPNRPVRMAGTLHWDFPFLFAEVLECLKAVAARGVQLQSLSVDTWGVDFGLLGDDGKLLGNPVHYRDSRTEGIHAYSEQFLSNDEIFKRTGYEPWPISSLFQLASLKRDNSPTLATAATFLNMPDLFNFLLTGQQFSERSIANTSNLMGTDGHWDRRIIDAFGLPEPMFRTLIEPATRLGPLSPTVREETGLGEVPVIATCGHDTSAALAAVPAQGHSWAFISCGTWSILGAMVAEPIATPRCLELGFTNEYTLGGWYLARNIIGLWLVQELRRKWNTNHEPWDYDKMTRLADAADNGPLIDVAHPSLMAPADMEDALLELVGAGDQPLPEGRGQLLLGVLESLALEYAYRLDSIGQLTGRPADTLYLVGGGTKNRLLCQLTADACGMTVHAGVDQCTALGNGLAQALAMGDLGDPQDIRDVVRNSFDTAVYEPRDAETWAEKRGRYAEIQGRKCQG